MPNVTKGFGVEDANFPWRQRRLKKWTRARMFEYLKTVFTSKHKLGLVLLSMLADCEFERFLVEGEYRSCINPKERRRLFMNLLKLDGKTLYFLRAAGLVRSGKALLTKRETEENDEPSELAKLIKFRPQPEKPKEGKE